MMDRCLSPDHDDTLTALSDSAHRLTRGEMRAQVAAHVERLRDAGVKTGDRVILHLPKSVVAVCAMLACLSMGAVAVPLDIRTPAMRRSKILDHIEPKLILAAPGTCAELEGSGFACLATDQLLSGHDGAVPERIDDSALALILMSSGSTGLPKAIQITRGNVASFVSWALETFQPTAQDRFLSVAPLHFDLSLFDILVSQSVGAQVHILSETQVAFPAEIVAAARNEHITFLYTVPTVLQMVLRLRGADMPHLRWLLFAGEVMPLETLRALPEIAPSAQLANLYGPTETNVVTWHLVTEQDLAPDAKALPIGWACPEARVWIADASGAPVPLGETGEICVEGPMVTPGYWRADALNETIRVSGCADSYRTGDMGWQDDNGEFHLAGRLDRKIKLRGNLVNLNEVEAIAMQSGVVAAVATVVENPGKLGASIDLFVVPLPGMDDTHLRLTRYLAATLPREQVPSRVIVTDRFPQTLNGKIDRRSLCRSEGADNADSSIENR